MKANQLLWEGDGTCNIYIFLIIICQVNDSGVNGFQFIRSGLDVWSMVYTQVNVRMERNRIDMGDMGDMGLNERCPNTHKHIKGTEFGLYRIYK